MLSELRELQEFKAKTEETTKAMQKQLTQANIRADALQQELETAKKEAERAREKLQKEFEREKEALQKAFQKEKEALEEQIANLNDQLEMATLDQQIAGKLPLRALRESIPLSDEARAQRRRARPSRER
jgi:predicted  nucleic acid-binding Zn-ribbon protein